MPHKVKDDKIITPRCCCVVTARRDECNRSRPLCWLHVLFTRSRTGRKSLVDSEKHALFASDVGLYLMLCYIEMEKSVLTEQLNSSCLLFQQTDYNIDRGLLKTVLRSRRLSVPMTFVLRFLFSPPSRFHSLLFFILLFSKTPPNFSLAAS